MTALRVLLVDDEPLVLRDLERLLAAEPDLEVVGTARSGAEAIERIDDLRPDVVFLDVQMPGLDGLGVVAALDPARAPLVVFVTAFDRYALPAFDADAVDFLLKPFDRERLARALHRVRQRAARHEAADVDRLQRAAAAALPPGAPYPERLAVRAAGRAIIVDLADVRWIGAEGNYARVHLAKQAWLTRRTLRDLEATLDPARFARVHRSHIVALGWIRELRPLGDGDHEVTLDSGARLVVTRTYRDDLARRLGGVA
jgi:two-component system LytT family response regulator